MNYSGSFERLQNILGELRQYCPWDKKQTIESLRPLTIEETYELGDAITKGDWQGIKEELGDILLHIIFYARIGEEQNQFSIEDVIRTVSQKLIERHPHIYSHVSVADESEVKRNWEQIKLKTKKQSLLSGVPDALPAMVKALRLQEKTKQVGFEWEETEQVYAKLEEELDELKVAVQKGSQEEREKELGDVLFSLVNYARFIKVDPELALERTNLKFKNRFEYLEQKAQEMNRNLSDMTLDEMNHLWEQSKSAYR